MHPQMSAAYAAIYAIYGTFLEDVAMAQGDPIPRMEGSQLIWRGVCVPLLHKESQGMAGWLVEIGIPG